MNKTLVVVVVSFLLMGPQFSTLAVAQTPAASNDAKEKAVEAASVAKTDASSVETEMPTEKAVEETAAESQLDIEDFVAGTVASVDATEKKITVNSEEGGEVVIYVNDATEIYLWDDQVKLGELKANDEVEIGYVTDQSKKNMATWVDIYREDAKAKAQGATPAQ